MTTDPLPTDPPDGAASSAERIEPAPAPSAGKPGPLARLQDHFKEYGMIGIATYFTIFFGTWGVFAAGIAFGFEVDGAMAGAGTLGASYVATKITQPIRIVATLALTPVVAAVMHRIRPRREALRAIEATKSNVDDTAAPTSDG